MVEFVNWKVRGTDVVVLAGILKDIFGQEGAKRLGWTNAIFLEPRLKAPRSS